MNQVNKLRNLKSRVRASLAPICLLLAAMLTACTPDAAPVAPPTTPDGGNVKIEKSNCETSGPLQLIADADGRYALTQIAPRADHFCAIILPIDGASLDLISTRTKVYDYRRNHPSDRISHVVFFNNLTLELTAIAEVVETIAGTPQDLARVTWLHSGSSLEGVLTYFRGRDYGFAIELAGFEVFTSPLSLADARTLDSKFQRPYTYLFLDRHPVIAAELQNRRPPVVAKSVPQVPSPQLDEWSGL